jgi:hypothetical protein
MTKGTGASADPLYRTTDLPHVVRLPVLGIPVAFATNSATVRDTVIEWFGMWEHLNGHPELLGTGETWVRIVEHEGREGTAGRPTMRYRMPDAARVVVHTPGSVGIVDTGRGDAVAYVTSELLEDGGHFAYGMLEMMTLVLVTVRDRLPLHASLVARDGVAILLAGPSGFGKSTLAYQARRAGWTLLADDGVYVQTAPTVRIWGGPRRLYLPPDAPRWFPELAGRTAEVQANGKTKIAVPHDHDWERDGPPVVERAAICLLDRAAGAAMIERVGPDVVRASLLADLMAAHDLYRDTADRVLTPLCADGGWRLALSPRPPDAASLLEELARDLAD